MNWKTINIEGISGIERFVIQLQLAAKVFPYADCDFRIYETMTGQFICRAGIAVRNKVTSKFEKIVGEGTTQEMAFDSAVKKLFEKIAAIKDGFNPDTFIRAEDGYVIYLKNYEY
jgi:hypothetical protein